jgi:CPA2 family monovalent cation:H+ antiporter-2
MEEVHAIPYLREIMLILAATGILIPLLSKFRISPVLGYLLAGFAVGPYGLGALPLPVFDYFTIKNPAQVAPLAEFGVVFLLFMIGLELSPRRLWDMRKLVFGLGFLQVLLSAAVIGPIAYLFGNSLAASIILGSCLALSSTAIVMQILMERRKLATPIGRTAFSILLFQDLAVVPILILLGILGAGATEGVGMAVLIALGKSAGVIAVILVVGYYILRPLFRTAGSASGSEPFMAIILLTIMVTATLTGMAGLSMALGAFLAGLLLAETEYRHAIEVYIEPFKGLLLGLFFMTVGMGLAPHIVMENLFWLCASVGGLITIKAALIVPLARYSGLSWGTALETGLLLGQAGEFAFVIVGSAMAFGIVTPATGQFMLIVTSLSMVATPSLSYFARKIRLYIEKKSSKVTEATSAEIPEMQGHVIIAGTGRVGRAITRVLEAESIPYLSIDNNTAVVDEKRKSGKEVFYGDASRHDLLKLFHPETAAAVVLTMEDAHAATHAISVIVKHWPGLPVFARARDMRIARLLHRAGATAVVAETVETSLQLTGFLLKGIGVEEEIVLRRLDIERDRAIIGIEQEQ